MNLFDRTQHTVAIAYTRVRNAHENNKMEQQQPPIPAGIEAFPRRIQRLSASNSYLPLDLVNFIPIFFTVTDAFVADSVSNEITLANVRDYSTILNVSPCLWLFHSRWPTILRRRIGSLGVYGSGGGNFSLFITYLFY